MQPQAIDGARVQWVVRIFGIERNKMEDEKGRALRMTDFINPDESGKPVSDLIKGITGGMGVDYFIECTGAVA